MRILKIVIISLVSILLVGVFLVTFLFNRAIKEPNKAISQNSLIKIEDGTTAQSLAADLKSRNLITSESYFSYLIRFYNKKINHGFYEIAANSSMIDIANLIDSSSTKVVKVTFPEGWRAEQVGNRLAANGIVDYSEFMAKAKGYEGQLFPDTYFFNPVMTADEVITMMTADYDDRVAGLGVTDDMLTLASIVEREAANDTDRALIAGIYSNRIKVGMKLQSDPTVEYGRDTNNIKNMTAADQRDYSFWKSAKTVEFTSVISPYNMYLHTGLPPTPICNPGLKSIEAALSPQANTYYYFLYGKDGEIHPSHNQAEHEAAIARYM